MMMMMMKLFSFGTLMVTLDHHPGGDSHISAVEFIDKKKFADRSVNP